jgi:hypothetical protein
MLAMAGGTNCTACADGQYSNASTAACRKCDVDWFSTVNSTACTHCAVNSSTQNQTGSSRCVCRAGHEGPLATLRGVGCTFCRSSHYKTIGGQHLCSRCNNNSESAVFGARLVSTCHCSAGYTGNIISPASKCHPCAAGSFKTTVGPGPPSGLCSSLDNAVAGVMDLLSVGGGVTQTAATQLSVLSDSLGTEPSQESIVARQQLIGKLVSAVPDPLTIDAATVSLTLGVLSSLTSAVDQLSDAATEDGFALATAMAQAPIDRSDCDHLASAVSNLFGATQKAFNVSQAEPSSEATVNATRKRGALMGSILESIALALTDSNGTGSEMSFAISTNAFEMMAHTSVTLGGNISMAGATVALPGGGLRRRRLANTTVGEDDFSLQMVRYAGAGPQLWAGKTIARHGTEAHMVSDTLTISMFGDARERVNLTLCEVNQSARLCLDAPAQIRLPANLSALSNSTCVTNMSTCVVYCAYWNVDLDEWTVDSHGQLIDDGTILCNTTHFTDFNTFIGAPPKFNKVQGLASLTELPTANPTGFMLSCLMLWVTIMLARYGAQDYKRLSRTLEDTEGDERERYEADAAQFAAHERHLKDTSVPWTTRAPGVLRIRWLAGSVLAPVAGDPWLRSQRAFMVVVQVLVALALGCLFYVEEEEVDEATNTTTLVEANGLQASLLTAAFAVPVIAVLNIGFSLLRVPMAVDLKAKTGELEEKLRDMDARRLATTSSSGNRRPTCVRRLPRQLCNCLYTQIDCMVGLCKRKAARGTAVKDGAVKDGATDANTTTAISQPSAAHTQPPLPRSRSRVGNSRRQCAQRILRSSSAVDTLFGAEDRWSKGQLTKEELQEILTHANAGQAVPDEHVHRVHAVATDGSTLASQSAAAVIVDVPKLKETVSGWAWEQIEQDSVLPALDSLPAIEHRDAAAEAMITLKDTAQLLQRLNDGIHASIEEVRGAPLCMAGTSLCSHACPCPAILSSAQRTGAGGLDDEGMPLCYMPGRSHHRLRGSVRRPARLCVAREVRGARGPERVVPGPV